MKMYLNLQLWKTTFEEMIRLISLYLGEVIIYVCVCVCKQDLSKFYSYKYRNKY